MEVLTELSEQIGLRIVGLLLIVAAVSTIGLWTLSTAVVSGESLFATYLSVDLISFSMIAYVYRVTNSGDDIRPIPLFAGCCMLLLLVFVGLSI